MDCSMWGLPSLTIPLNLPSSCSLNQWFHPTISSSVALFFFCLHYFPASGSCSVSWLFISSVQNTGASTLQSILPVSIQGWFPLRVTLKSLLQHHSSKASVLQCSVFFLVPLSHPYLTTGKAIVLTIWTFIGKVMYLLFNTLSTFVIASFQEAIIF